MANSDKDSFWDLSKLVPKKSQAKPFSAGVKCAEVTVDAPGDDSSFSQRRLSFEGIGSDTLSQGIPDKEYAPCENSFIKSVRIKHSLDRYDFYGNFRKAALVYYGYRTEKCEYVPFYSYMPQYSQLSSAQKNYYFYWRDELKMHRYVKADYSYICLYAFEILNLPDKIPPKDGIRLLCEVWKNYRAQAPRLDSDFAVWVQDYCLVWGLPAPIEYVSDFLEEIINLTPLKEFYLTEEAISSREHRDTILSALSDYDWKKVKYATGESAAIYARHMRAAMSAVLSDIWFSGDLFRSLASTETLRRPAFARSICTHKVKCDLEIDYSPLSASTLRDKITSAVRYCENKLRALIGVKSRLTVKDMDGYFAHIIDRYFDAVYKTEGEKRRAELTPEYEKLYDAPRGELSFSGASMIEAGSWQTTARLVVEDECEEIVPTLEVASDNREAITESRDVTAEIQETSSCEGLLKNGERELLSACLAARSPARSLAFDALAERINEALYDEIGDIVIELIDCGYNIIDDYREDIERLINNDK